MSKKTSLDPSILLSELHNILKNNGERLDEKAVSKNQQQFMGMVHAAQTGEKAASPAVAKVAKSMSKKDVTDFAKTKHKGLPNKIKKEDQIEDEGLAMFSRKNVGKRSGRGQSDNAWNNMHQKGRGFKSRVRKEDADGGMEECSGVGIVNKQNSTKDVGPDTLSKNLKAFNLEEAMLDMYNTMIREGKVKPDSLYRTLVESDTPANPKKMPEEHTSSIKGGISMPGLSQNKSNGNAYLQYRMGIAMAGAPEFPTQAAGAFAGDPLLSTYTDEELEIVNYAAQQVGAGKMVKLGSNRSEEVPGVNTQSAIGQAKKNKYGI